ncbi:site-specific DNA-methyltransferase, partial [Corynebacterium diphtheriae bv. mitis]
LEQLVRIFTDPGDVVIDPCAGSGSTLVAAENLDRKAYGFEIKKEFCEGFEKRMKNSVTMSLPLGI